jgi:3-hydroxyisobutyrate dehydrogenase-like beta-hydroxyacid dehydrogenase
MIIDVMANVGFIGLGAMGAPMAANIREGGHQLAVFARRKEAMEPLVRLGAIACESPMEVARRSDTIFTMVTDTQAVSEIIFGNHGIVHGATSGAVVIDHSTISPNAARRMAGRLKERGVEMLDAPVSGGIAGAEAGTLSIMVGGDEGAFERSRPLLACVGRTIVHIGASGAGQVAKACNQICIVLNQLGVAEAMLLAERSGVDPLKVKDALMGGFAASRILDLQAPKMVARNFEGAIESRLHHKDILIALEVANELGITLPGSRLAADVLTKLQEAGGARQDSAAVFKVIGGGSAA